MEQPQRKVPRSFREYLESTEETIEVFRWIYREVTTDESRKWLYRMIGCMVIRIIMETFQPAALSYVFNGAASGNGSYIVWGLGAVLGSLLVQLQSILDGCDGEIARLKFKSSKVGEWLDNILDDQVNVGYGIGLGFAAPALRKTSTLRPAPPRSRRRRRCSCGALSARCR